MDIRQLQYFKTVYECGSIAKASEQLHISRQALSMSLHQIEKEYQVTLLSSNKNNKITFSNIANEFYNKTLIVLNAFHDLENVVKEKKTKEIRIGIGPAVIYHFNFSDLLTYQDYKIKFIEGNNDYLYSLLDENKLDFILVGTSLDYLPFKHHHLIIRNPLSLLLHKQHPLANKEIVYFSDLKDVPFVGYGESNDLHKYYVKRCKEHGFEPTFGIITPEINTIVQFIENHSLVGFGVPNDCFKDTYLSKNLTQIHLHDDHDTWGIYLASKHNHPLLKTYTKHLLQIVH